MVETFELNTAEDLFELVSPWRDNPTLSGFIFRGHSQETYQLIPSALRPESIDTFWEICGGRPTDEQHTWQMWQVYAEYNILRSFYRLADQNGLEVPISDRMRANLAQDHSPYMLVNPFESGHWIPKDLYETAALAQHYGIPTRLLDWTYDIYVSMFFAFKGASDKAGKMAIWALNKEHLCFLKTTVDRSNVEFITPHYAGNPNLNAQKGLFTHWPLPRPPLCQDSCRPIFFTNHYDRERQVNEKCQSTMMNSRSRQYAR